MRWRGFCWLGLVGFGGSQNACHRSLLFCFGVLLVGYGVVGFAQGVVGRGFCLCSLLGLGGDLSLSKTMPGRWIGVIGTSLLATSG